MPKRRVDEQQGRAALAAWERAYVAAHAPTAPDSTAADSTTVDPELPRPVLFTAVRYLLEEIAALHPGRAVEVRIPPAGAAQILPGTTHRRGTPPAVIETDPVTWLELATGKLFWEDALAVGRVQASGERTNLAPYLTVI